MTVRPARRGARAARPRVSRSVSPICSSVAGRAGVPFAPWPSSTERTPGARSRRRRPPVAAVTAPPKARSPASSPPASPSASASWCAGSAGGGPSLITSVGTQFIDRFAASLKDLAVQLFGTNDKAALVTGIVIVSLALGAVLGKAPVRRWWVGVAGFAAFGALGLWSYLEDPLGSSGTGVVAAVLAAAAGIGTLFGLLRLLRARRAPPVARRRADPASSRRLFLTAAGSLAVIAAGAAVLGRRLRAQRRRRAGPRGDRPADGDRRSTRARAGAAGPVPGRRRACRRSSRRTTTSTASTPRSSSRRSTSPTGS